MPATLPLIRPAVTRSTSEKVATRGASRLRRRLGIALGVFVAIVAVGESVYRSWAARHEELFHVGSSIDQFLGRFSKKFQNQNLVALNAMYAERAPVDFFHNVVSKENVDDVTTVYMATEEIPMETRSQQINAYFREVGQIEKAKFKLNRVFQHDRDRSAQIRSRFQVWGTTCDQQRFYDSGRLHLQLSKNGAGEWQIDSQRVIDATRVYEAANAFFTDVTRESGILTEKDALTDCNVLVKDWKFSVTTRAGRGVAVADIDADGDMDVLTTGFRRASLWVNDGQGKFEDEAVALGIDRETSSHSIFPLFADYDGDADPDLLLLRLFGKSKLLRNDGGSFVDVTDQSGLHASEFAYTAALADYDNDGDLDVYVGSYGNARERTPANPICSTNGEPDQFFLNNGDGTFAEVTRQVGIVNHGWALASTFLDINEDGYSDLYVANDFGYNKTFVNNGDGTFSDHTWSSGAHDIGSSMSVSLLDYDADGDLDVCTSAIATNTTWFQGPGTNYLLARFIRSSQSTFSTLSSVWKLGTNLPSHELNQLGYKISQGNSLLRNDGDGTFSHVESDAGVNWAEWAWGAATEDFDCDGDVDMYVTNGFITGEEKDDL